MKTVQLAAASLILVAAALAGCQKPAEPAPEGEPAAQAVPETKPGLSLTGGELVLPVVSGRPGAVYFTLNNASDTPVTLVSAYVDGAGSAEIHETAGGTMRARDAIEIAAGDSVTFARGALHVMAFELPEDLSEGGTSELTLSFSDGDKLSAPLTIKSMTGDSAMAGMEHGEHP